MRRGVNPLEVSGIGVTRFSVAVSGAVRIYSAVLGAVRRVWAGLALVGIYWPWLDFPRHGLNLLVLCWTSWGFVGHVDAAGIC